MITGLSSIDLWFSDLLQVKKPIILQKENPERQKSLPMAHFPVDNWSDSVLFYN